MPLYTFTSQVSTLDDEQKALLAQRLTDLHVELAGVPSDWVHVVFHDYSRGSGFTAGKAAPTVALVVTIRKGRSDEYKRTFLHRLWDVVQQATNVPDDQLVLGLEELAASQAMEMGRIMPDVSTVSHEQGA